MEIQLNKDVDHGGLEPPSLQCECSALPDKLMAQDGFKFFDYFINSLGNKDFLVWGKWLENIVLYWDIVDGMTDADTDPPKGLSS